MVADARSESTLLFDLDDRQLQAGELFEVTLTANQAVQCYQFSLNTNGLELLEISGKGMQADNFAVFAQDQALTTSWNVPEGFDAVFASFTMKCRATQAGRLSEMLGLSSRITKVEAYKKLEDKTSIRMEVALRFKQANGASIHGPGFELYQNEPNPFVDKTTIGFYLPSATQATLTIFDETGRLIFSQQGDFDKGYNSFFIERPLIQTNGMLLYKLATETDSATRKMIQGK